MDEQALLCANQDNIKAQLKDAVKSLNDPNARHR